jgi:purine-binding chemotaxis protein CheW
MAAKEMKTQGTNTVIDTSAGVPPSESKHVVFKVGNEFYALPIERVERIVPSVALTRIPRTPPMFLGVFDLRGEALPCIDLRLRFEMVASETAEHFVVIQTDVGRCALRVDEVDGIFLFSESQIDRSLELFDRKDDPFVQGVAKNDGKLVVMLEVDEVIPRALRAKIARQQAEPLAA